MINETPVIDNPTPKPHEYLFKENWRDWYEVKILFDAPDYYKVTAVRERKHYEDVLFYIIELADKVILIDTGSGFAPIDELIPKNKEIIIFLTHSDWDHTGNAGELARRLGAKIYIGGRDTEQYEVTRMKKGWATEEISGLKMEQFTGDLQPEIDALLLFFIASLSAEEFKTFTFDDEGFHRMQFGEGDAQITIDIIHTPGHTPGGVCFFISGKIDGKPFGHLFSGDMLYPAFQDLTAQGSDAEAYYNSLRLLQDKYYDVITEVMPGHNAPVASRELLKAHVDALEMLLKPEEELIGSDQSGTFIDEEYKGEKDIYFILRLKEEDARPKMVELATKHILQNLYLSRPNDFPDDSWSEMLRKMLSVMTGGRSEAEYEEKWISNISPKEFFYQLRYEIAYVQQVAVKWTPTRFVPALIEHFKELKKKIDAVPEEEQESLITPIITVETEADNGWKTHYGSYGDALPVKNKPSSD